MSRFRHLVSHTPWLTAMCVALVCVASSRADDKSDLIGVGFFTWRARSSSSRTR